MNDLNNDIQSMSHVALETWAAAIDVVDAYNKALDARVKETSLQPTSALAFSWPTVGADTATALLSEHPEIELSNSAFYEALNRAIAVRTTEWVRTLKLKS